MKKYYSVLFILISSIEVFGNGLLGQVESNSNFHTPVKTVEAVLKHRGNIQKLSEFVVQDGKIIDGVYKRVQNLSKIDFSNLGQVKICTYIDQSNQLIKARFLKKHKHWLGDKIFNANGKALKVQKIFSNKKYEFADETNCFIPFVDTWNQVYPNALLQSSGDEEFIVSNILVAKGGQVLNAVFTLKYIQPTQENFRSGWLVSSLKLKTTKRKIIQAKPIPSYEDGFFIKESIAYNPNIRLEPSPGKKGLLITNKSQKVKVLGLSCNQYENKVRVAFILDKDILVNTLLREESGSNLFGFDMMTTKKTVKKLGNCSFLKVQNHNNLLYLDLQEFKRNISSIQYGAGSKANKSFIDLYFDREMGLIDRIIN